MIQVKYSQPKTVLHQRRVNQFQEGKEIVVMF